MHPIIVEKREDAPPDVDWESHNDGMGSKGYGFCPSTGEYYCVKQVGEMGPVQALMDTSPGTQAAELMGLVDDAFESPEMKSVLTGVVGRNYVMDASPHVLQNSAPGRSGQQWHKGGGGKRRHHRPRWVFGFYYPQDVRDAAHDIFTQFRTIHLLL